ncbi:MAG: sulfate adenylyltransferase subunit CysN [Hyphomicrobiales bacterium]|nr:sulfate adenylyltransferase subunit CysN [Hyphomicrobiales bacterium]MDE2113666.1 sulfate adenylyltransferase subunit CysN [Hyphomicrobiales bacterium]
MAHGALALVDLAPGEPTRTVFAGRPAATPVAGARSLPALRFLTCGSVDDGKSTLIGRLLHEQHLILDDQLAALEKDSARHGTDGDNMDFALLVDGLEAEREQGITIDVAYRYFATARRTFIVADTPGHEQYTRNMATGASNADCAILLVDARKGLLTQTFRHANILSLLGLRHVVLAVNKMDLVDFSQSAFEAIAGQFQAFADRLGLAHVYAVPISARAGDNVSSPSARMGWFKGASLLHHLETLDLEAGGADLPKPFRLPVQWVNRPNLDFRGFSGTLASGQVQVGDEIVVANSGQTANVSRIHTANRDLAQAQAGDAITLVLDREVDIARGDILTHATHRPQVADQFSANLIWMAQEKLLPGRSYWLKIGTRTLPASVSEIKHRLDVNSLEPLAAKALGMNEIGLCNINLSQAIAFDAFADNSQTGAFILIDRTSHATVAAGMIRHALRRATNVHRQPLSVSAATRAAQKQQKPIILWFTGLSGAGKSTVANLVEAELVALGAHTTLLDGDNVRHGLNKNLGFTDADRVENIRRVGEVAKLMLDAGLIVLCSFISPFRADREMVRALVGEGEFIEVYVQASIAACIARDPKGLYKKALSGEIKNFTGVDQPYEAPERAEIVLDADHESPQVLAQVVVQEIRKRGLIERIE